MGKDFEIEEGKEVVRRTIVGGRPLARKKRKLKIPIGIEKVLCRAAVDPAFRASLFDNRDAALDGLGGELSEAEADILKSIPAQSLETMIARIDPKKHAGRRFMKGVMAATLVTAALTTSIDCLETRTKGATADDPTADDIRAGETFAPEAVVKGIQPDDVLGAPDVVETQDGQAILGIDPDVGEPDVVEKEEVNSYGIDPELDVIEHEDLMAPGGIIPDAE